jgi:glutaredoxin-like protein NrdH
MAEQRGSMSGVHQEHQVMLYALSTCIWCRKTRQFLEDESVAFDFIYVDLLEGDEREAVKGDISEWNPRVSFPTIVIDNEECVIGYKTDALRQALDL